MSLVRVSSHPLVAARLTALRDRTTPPPEFRRLVRTLATMVTLEAIAELPSREIAIQTPLGTAPGRTIEGLITLVPILRAGLGMCDGVLDLLPEARVCHIGLFRDEVTLEPTTYYQRLCPANAGELALVLDPMLATGGSALRACELVKAAGFGTIMMIALIAAPEGIKRLSAAMPEVAIHVGAVDERLTDFGFIYPGLGDAGDRQFAT